MGDRVESGRETHRRGRRRCGQIRRQMSNAVTATRTVPPPMSHQSRCPRCRAAGPAPADFGGGDFARAVAGVSPRARAISVSGEGFLPFGDSAALFARGVTTAGAAGRRGTTTGGAAGRVPLFSGGRDGPAAVGRTLSGAAAFDWGANVLTVGSGGADERT